MPRRTPTDQQFIAAYNVVNLLPADATRARAILRLADELLDDVPERGYRLSLRAGKPASRESGLRRQAG